MMNLKFLEQLFGPITAFEPWIYYVICGVLSVFVLLGIYFMSDVKKSVLGNRISAAAMLVGIIVTLIYYFIFPFWILYVAIAIGTVIGIFVTIKIKMIQMPQLVALLNGLGGASSAIVGAFSLYGVGILANTFSVFTSAFAIFIGMVTLFGSLVAAGKLHRVLPQKSIVLKGHKYYTLLSLLGSVALIIVITVLGVNSREPLLDVGLPICLFILSGFFGVVFSIRVGGADMPITISLLNSFSGVAAAVAGLAISDVLLVSIGGIVGASGLLLTKIMCKAMNRSLIDILLSKGISSTKKPEEKTNVEAKKEDDVQVKSSSSSNLTEVLKGAKKVIIVPGYGMAIAQAQHLVKKLQDFLTSNGAIVKYAIHPVAGRMPGHMNVLLCEANVDYEDLYEMEQINSEFEETDLTIVVGANDVINPSARFAEGTPIYGMPILDVDKCKNIAIFNYDLKPGYAGVENPLYTRENGVYKNLGDAKDTLSKLLEEISK